MVSKLSRLWIFVFLPATASLLLAEKAAINIDGQFEDWQDIDAIISDGDDGSSPQIDFGRLWVADDANYLFLRLEIGATVDPSENNGLVLILDGGLGRVLEWQFGNRAGSFRINGSIVNNNVRYADIGFRSMPTLDTDELEMAIRLDARPDGSTPLFAGTEIRIRFEDASGDRIPNTGPGIQYNLGIGTLPEDTPLGLDKKRSTDLRVVTYNILNDNLFNQTLQPGFRRQLQAVQPDVIHFQEIRTNTPQATRALIQNWLPLPEEDQWYAVGGSTNENDTITVSRFPILGRWDLYGSSALSGNLAMLLDTADELGTETLMINAHLPSRDNNDGPRQQEVDTIMAFIRNAKNPGGAATLNDNTPIIIAGDMNFVGRTGQLNTLLTGNISNNNLHGPDFTPDWDGTSLISITPRLSDQRMGYTWRSDFENNFWPGHLDYIIYSDNVIDLVQSYVVHTPSMSGERLQEYGLLSSDSLGADHLIFVADFRPGFVDADQNGLPDYWEKLHWDEVGTSTDNEDVDFDGASNLQEFEAGTDPKDKNSVFRISNVSLNEGEVHIYWNTVEDRTYNAQISFDFIEWIDFSEPIQGTGQTASQLLPREFVDRVYYRIVVY